MGGGGGGGVTKHFLALITCACASVSRACGALSDEHGQTSHWARVAAVTRRPLLTINQAHASGQSAVIDVTALVSRYRHTTTMTSSADVTSCGVLWLHTTHDTPPPPRNSSPTLFLSGLKSYSAPGRNIYPLGNNLLFFFTKLNTVVLFMI